MPVRLHLLQALIVVAALVVVEGIVLLGAIVEAARHSL